MYDNNYPNENPAADSSTSGAASVNRNAAADHTAQAGSGSYYQNTYGGNYGQNAARDPYGNRAAGYPYNNNYSGGYMQMNGTPGTDHPKKAGKHERKKIGGYLKKALISVSLGLLFGLFAGIGIYAIQSVTDMFGEDSKKAEISEVSEAGDVSGDVSAAADVTAKEPQDSAEADQSGSGIRAAGSSAGTDGSRIETDVTDVVEKVMPSIVSINSHLTQTMSYFGQSFTNEADSSGSGIIVGENDTELLIATNYHVIADTEKLTVQFVEGSEAEASVKGTDEDMDLAVIAVPLDKIDNNVRKSIAIATLGDSDSLQVGEPAIAIGNSLGYGQSVTTGVISALNRSMELSDGSKSGSFIQTDAAINPGNSGGALLNIKGEVIGINSNKIGGAVVEGMGYAIPISSASPIIAELMLKETKNKVAEEERGYLGITGINVTEYVSQTYGMPEGVYISQVYDNTAAAAAGLMKGDIITAFEGEDITSMDELQRQLEYYAMGDTVTVTIMSPGMSGYESRQVELTLGGKVQNG